MSEQFDFRDGPDPLRASLKACRAHFVHCALFSGFINVLLLAPSVYMLQVYDRAIPSRAIPTLGALTAIFLIAMATMTMLELLRARLLIRASARLDRLLAPRLIADLLGNAVRKSRGRGALRDFDQLRQALTGPGMIALFDAPWAPIYVLVCWMVHPALAGMAVAAMGLLATLSWLNERSSRGPLKEANAAATASYASLDGSLGAAGVLKALGMHGAMGARHRLERLLSLDRQVTASATNAFYVSLTKGLRITLQSLALGLGAWLAITGSISGGAIFAASLLIGRALAPIEGITAAAKSFVQAVGAYRALSTLVEGEAASHVAHTQLPAPTGVLQVEGVSLHVPGRDEPVLRDIAFTLPAGSVLGIVGPSGTGKSTLARALVGATEPSTGAVRIDGASLADWDPAQIGAATGYVPQDACLFRGTVRDNIARFSTGEDRPDGRALVDAEVVRAARECGAHDMILGLAKGYDTELGWGGTGLSSGQAQRVALARALFGSPALVVLDEPNANLDNEGDAALVRTIATLKARGATVLVIAHRTSVLCAVDTLLVLRAGRMEHFGPRDAVLHKLAPPPPPAPAVSTPTVSAPTAATPTVSASVVDAPRAIAA